jgi:hypothetical protein
MTEQIITKELLNKLFEYKDGELFRKSGKKAGCINKVRGYKSININGKSYTNHRLIFLMHNNYLPKYLDHIDNNRLNNKIENLREATRSQNQHNRKLNTNNKSGAKNVSWNQHNLSWRVRINFNKKLKFIGYYADIELAKLAAIEAREKYHGTFANHG